MPTATGRERTIAAIVLALTAAVVFVCFAPGRMTNDTIFQINEVATGDFTNQHSPLLQALWRPFFEAGVGPAWVLLAQVLAFVAAGYLILRAALRRIPAAVVTAAICLFPPVLLMLGTVMRDTWFTSLVLLVTGLCVRALQVAPRWRWPLIGAVAAVVWLAMAARQNAATMLAPILVVFAYLLLTRYGPARRRVALGIAVVASALLAIAVTQVVATHVIGVRDVNPEQAIYVYDLGSASVRDDQNYFPADVMAERDPAAIDRAWDVDSMIRLIYGTDPLIYDPLPSEPYDSLRDAWWDRLRDDPFGYLQTRTDLFTHQLALGADAVLVAPSETQYGFDHWVGPAHSAAEHYLGWFTDDEDSRVFVEDYFAGPLFSVWVYLLLALGACIVLLRRGMPRPWLLAGALALSALALQVGLYLGAPGSSYRFEFPAVAAALFCLPVAVVAFRRPRALALAQRAEQGRTEQREDHGRGDGEHVDPVVDDHRERE